jgi:hypothetical protein
MSATEDRAERLRIAQELLTELRGFRQRIDLVINHMLSDADSLKIAAADEVSRGEVPKTKAITFTARIDATEPNITPPPAPAVVVEATPLPPGKRACSICRRPGHRAKNCPNAHVVQQQKKDAVAARDAVKKGRRKRG